MAEGVFRDDLVVMGVVSDRVRSGPYDRHFAPQDVKELRQLVDAEPPDPNQPP